MPPFPFVITDYPLDPDLDLEEPEKQEKQGNGQNDFQCFFTEKLLGPTAEHTAGKATDDDGDGQPHIRQVPHGEVSDKRTDTGKTGTDQ